MAEREERCPHCGAKVSISQKGIIVTQPFVLTTYDPPRRQQHPPKPAREKP